VPLATAVEIEALACARVVFRLLIDAIERIQTVVITSQIIVRIKRTVVISTKHVAYKVSVKL
jgi:hypothetical protein